MKFANAMIGMPFGRTDFIVVGASDAPCPELSHGSQGRLVSQAFEGVFFVVVIFLVFLVTSSSNWKREIGKTRVGFGRTEVSIPQWWSSRQDLKNWHGFRDRGSGGRIITQAFLTVSVREKILLEIDIFHKRSKSIVSFLIAFPR